MHSNTVRWRPNLYDIRIAIEGVVGTKIHVRLHSSLDAVQRILRNSQDKLDGVGHQELTETV